MISLIEIYSDQSENFLIKLGTPNPRTHKVNTSSVLAPWSSASPPAFIIFQFLTSLSSPSKFWIMASLTMRLNQNLPYTMVNIKMANMPAHSQQRMPYLQSMLSMTEREKALRVSPRQQVPIDTRYLKVVRVYTIFDSDRMQQIMRPNSSSCRSTAMAKMEKQRMPTNLSWQKMAEQQISLTQTLASAAPKLSQPAPSRSSRTYSKLTQYRCTLESKPFLANCSSTHNHLQQLIANTKDRKVKRFNRETTRSCRRIDFCFTRFCLLSSCSSWIDWLVFKCSVCIFMVVGPAIVKSILLYPRYLDLLMQQISWPIIKICKQLSIYKIKSHSHSLDFLLGFGFLAMPIDLPLLQLLLQFLSLVPHLVQSLNFVASADIFLQASVQDLVFEAIVDESLQHFMGFQVQGTILAEGFQQPAFLQGRQLGDHFLEGFLRQIPGTCQRVAFLNLEIIQHFSTVDFLQVPFHLNILITFEDVVDALQNIRNILAVLEQVALDHGHGELELRQPFSKFFSDLLILEEPVAQALHLEL